MASPQCESGFTRFANELLEALAHIRIPGEARQVLDVIIRKTYGFNKKEDAIALSQFCLATGRNKPHVCQALSKLRTMNLITERGNGGIKTYGINKDFGTWKALPKKVTLPNKIINVTEEGKASLPKKVHTINNTTKDTLTKDIPALNQEFRENFWNPYPQRNGKKIGKDTTFELFLKHIKTEERSLLYMAVKNYAASGQMPKDPARFIKDREYKNGYWREWIEPEQKTERPPKSDIPKDSVLEKIKQAERESVV